MAYVNSTRATQSSVSDRFSGVFAAVSAMMQRRRIYAQTLRELRSLSDRELTDLGLCRSMIVEVSREAAYGK
ncbi:MAG: hypothetical protein FD162_1744 [Rhodobacteraceae bacterium]|uniref:DUF1127 domain-containing protein n=1 Tax=Cypionkella sp. TaxID=2811411 RepID=UPI00132437C4|nr:DUF1127 domain-containing protein [Cypionkella sp.]KAF0173460.1 MAG: hypothetical protein FD162_1744 [Paracoccaceae bacterium]MDO8325425.1 DUF1127 domain-containing protein [Cypionkella sp.]